MQKKIYLMSCLLLLNFFRLSAQSIENIQAYFKLDGTRYIAQLSDNTLWWFDQKKWQEIPRINLPQKKIKFLEAYMKTGLASWGTRVVCVLDDNSIWWYDNQGKWEEIENEGLPKDNSIKDFKAYVKMGMLGGGETRFVAVLNDNSVWWFDGKLWNLLSAKGLPENSEILTLRTYQKMALLGGGSETRYIAKLSNNDLYWCDGEKWKLVENAGIPAKKPFQQFEVYMKTVGSFSSTQEGRFIATLEDQTIWWFAASGKSWTKLDSKGLPKDYRIRALKVYQKYAGLSGESRLIVLLEDGTLWWYADKKNWTPVSLEGLPEAK